MSSNKKEDQEVGINQTADTGYEAEEEEVVDIPELQLPTYCRPFPRLAFEELEYVTGINFMNDDDIPYLPLYNTPVTSTYGVDSMLMDFSWGDSSGPVTSSEVPSPPSLPDKSSRVLPKDVKIKVVDPPERVESQGLSFNTWDELIRTHSATFSSGPILCNTKPSSSGDKDNMEAIQDSDGAQGQGSPISEDSGAGDLKKDFDDDENDDDDKSTISILDASELNLRLMDFFSDLDDTTSTSSESSNYSSGDDEEYRTFVELDVEMKVVE